MPANRYSKPIRVALYGRVSTAGNGQSVGLQIEELRRIAEQGGWEVVTEYADEGVSRSRSSSPALDPMMTDAKAGRVHVIAVWELDRLARSVVHLVEIAEGLQAWGVGVVSVRDAHVDPTTACAGSRCLSWRQSPIWNGNSSGSGSSRASGGRRWRASTAAVPESR